MARTRGISFPGPAPPPPGLWASGPLLPCAPASEAARCKKLLCGQGNAPPPASLADASPDHLPLHTPQLPAPPPPQHPAPQDSLRGLDFDGHCVLFLAAEPSLLSGLAAQHTNDTSGGRPTSLPLDVRRPPWRRDARERGVEYVRGGARRGCQKQGSVLVSFLEEHSA